MMGSTAMRGSTLEPWLRELTPARITVLDLKTGGRFTEPSYVAAEYETVETTGRDPAAGGTRTFPHLTLRRYLAAGRGPSAMRAAPMSWSSPPSGRARWPSLTGRSSWSGTS